MPKYEVKIAVEAVQWYRCEIEAADSDEAYVIARRINPEEGAVNLEPIEVVESGGRALKDVEVRPILDRDAVKKLAKQMRDPGFILPPDYREQLADFLAENAHRAG